MKRYWLLKSEPEAYSIDDLKRDGETLWTGVRNYQARNSMVGEAELKAQGKPGLAMNKGDLFLFYHSNADLTACMGIGRIDDVNQVDPTQFDKKSDVFEPKATRAKPMWFCAKVAFVKKLDRPVSLAELRKEPALGKMVLLQKGSRLSVQPVTAEEFDTIVQMATKKNAL